jgi:hypothetical protein
MPDGEDAPALISTATPKASVPVAHEASTLVSLADVHSDCPFMNDWIGPSPSSVKPDPGVMVGAEISAPLNVKNPPQVALLVDENAARVTVKLVAAVVPAVAVAL